MIYQKHMFNMKINNPRTLLLISLDECKGSSISISVPVNLDESTISIYDSLQKSGYNLFNLSDSFYNDICSTYTTGDGTDSLCLIEKISFIIITLILQCVKKVVLSKVMIYQQKSQNAVALFKIPKQ